MAPPATRTHGLHTKPTPRAGPGKGATSRIEHMQGKKNNTEPKFTTYVYIQKHDIQILNPRTQNTMGAADNRGTQSENGRPIQPRTRLAARLGFVTCACKPVRPNMHGRNMHGIKVYLRQICRQQ